MTSNDTWYAPNVVFGAFADHGPQIAYAKCHIDWAKKNAETWREAKEEVKKIETR